MKLPRYPEYRDSGVEWLGAVPGDWDVARLKSKVSLVTEKAKQRTRAVALENVESWSGRFIPTGGEFEGEGVAFCKGDLLFGKLRPYLAKVYLADEPGEAVGDFHVIRAVRGFEPRFLQYQILNRSFIDIVDGTTFGSKMPRASWEALGGMPVMVPSIAEQRAIAIFLDRETAKIDTLLAEQERLLALLAEKRQAAISHAVSKGLNPDAPKKDSGMQWLGEVPAHWDIVPLRHVSKIGNGSTPNRDNPAYWAEAGTPWLNSSVVNQIEVTSSDQYVTPVALRECHLPVVAPPAILVGITGQGRTRGMASPLKFEATISQHIAYVKPVASVLDVNYLRNFLECSYFRLREESDAAGSTKGAITCDQLSRLKVPLPPINEQVDIAGKISSDISKMDSLSDAAIRSKEILLERRAALIAAAVTGRIDVREVA